MSSLFGIGAGSASTGFYPETINQSLRFNDDDSPLLDRTPSSASNRDTFTVSFWVKRSNLGTNQGLWQQGASNNNSTSMFFLSTDTLRYQHTDSGSATDVLITNAVFRDITNWYHIVLSVDTTQATDTNRVKIYVNGTEQTYSTANYPVQNVDTDVNSTGKIRISGQVSGTHFPFDGYLAEFNLIDGTALDPTSFGELKNGTWIPKSLSSISYGTNGFRLTFADSSSLGDDTSGNGNDFTASGLASTDVVPDSPTNNFCVINSIREPTVYNGSVTLSEGNLQSVDAGTTYSLHWTATFGMSTGKWYWEVLAHTMGGTKGSIGICNSLHKVGTAGTGVFYGNNGNREAVTYYTPTTTYGDSYTNGDIIGVAFDADNETVTFYKNNSSQGAVGSVLTTANGEYFPAVGDAQNATTYKFVANFGQDSSFAGNKTAQGNKDGNGVGDFYYSPPSGYLALCSSNLPDTTLSPNQTEQATDYFETQLWSGDSSASRNISLYDFQPDWVWVKNRGAGNVHILNDSSRGVSTALDKALTSGNTDTEGLGDNHTTSAQYGDLSAFLSNGFTLAEGTIDARYVNKTSNNYAGFAWKAGGTTPSKTYKVVVVSDSGNKFRFRNSSDSATFPQSAVTLNLQELGTYTFDVSDSSMSGHALKFSTTSDGIHGGGLEYTTGVTSSGTSGQSGAYVQITVASSAPTLYYYCGISGHSGMGGQINTNSTHGSTNFDGTILTVEQASTEAGFGIVTYTGTGSAVTIGHGLGAVPKWILIKDRDATRNWMVYHVKNTSAPETDYLHINTTNGTQDSAVFWNDTAPTSTVISLGTGTAVNTTGNSYVGYVFSEIEGYSKFGSYTGNGNATGDGAYVFLGFRPQWLMIKRTDSTSGWVIWNNKVSTSNPTDDYLLANDVQVEQTGTNTQRVDFLSNGFKAVNTSTSNTINGSNTTHIYIAFAEQPFKFSNAR